MNLKKCFNKIYTDQLKNINESYSKFLSEGDRSKCFMEWLQPELTINNSLFESKDIENSDEEKLENNEPIDKKQEQKKLENAVEDELQESQFWDDVESGQQLYLKSNKLGNTVYDNSAGFVTSGIGTSLNQKQRKIKSKVKRK